MNGIVSPKSKQSSTVVTPKIVKRAGVARISNHDEIIHEVKIILEDYASKAYVEPLMTLSEQVLQSIASMKVMKYKMEL